MIVPQIARNGVGLNSTKMTTHWSDTCEVKGLCVRGMSISTYNNLQCFYIEKSINKGCATSKGPILSQIKMPTQAALPSTTQKKLHEFSF